MSPPIAPVTLEGRHVRLIPLSTGHEACQIEAASDGELWNLWYTAVPTPQGMQAEITRRLGLLAAGSMVPFTVMDSAGAIVGMTTYMNIDAVTPRLEIGHTWYAARVQRGPLNTEAKLLLLTHAIETLGCSAVEFRTHFMNQQSRRAIERLGARLDGILRHHALSPNGALRDTCVYSITAPDWPAARAHLQWQLKKPR